MLMIKMKDSKIEWIGQIPENWKIIPIYTCTSEVTQKNSDLKEKWVIGLEWSHAMFIKLLSEMQEK